MQRIFVRRQRAPFLFLVVVALLVGFRPAQAQDPLKVFPDNYSLLFENSTVAVIHVHYGPHEKVGVHDHSRFPTVYVYLSDSPPVRFIHDETPPFILTRRPLHAGAFRVSPGRVERHSVENLGDTSSDFLRVELKQMPLGAGREFRGTAPQTLARDRQAIEVQEPGLRIERIVCTGHSGPCPIEKLQAESLLIAFTPLRYGLSRRSTTLPAGGVAWVDARQIGAVSPGGPAAAHMLVIATAPAGKSTTASVQ